MSEQDRGVFVPDQMRVFDGSIEDDDDEGSRLPVLIVIALVVLASFAGVVWLAYEKGVASGRNETRLAVTDADAPAASQENAPATPAAKVTKAFEDPAPDDADSGPPAAAAAVTASGTSDVVAPAAAVKPIVPAPRVAAKTPAPVRSPAVPAPQKIAVTQSAPARITTPAQNLAAENSDLTVATAAPPAVRATSPAAKTAPAPKTAPPAVKVAPPSIIAASPAIAVPRSLNAAGQYFLQIGAYKSEADANSAWDAAKQRFGVQLRGRSPDVKKADLGPKGVWYRLRIAAFDSRDDASAVCGKLKSAGGSCIIAH